MRLRNSSRGELPYRLRKTAVIRAGVSASLELLEQRRLFSVPVIGGVPQLSSNPSASAKLYLDFDGDPAFTFNGIAVPPTPAYSAGGDTDTTSFTDKEVAYIREIWARVAEQFSPFNLDVTTVDPGVYPDKVALKVVIGGQGLWAGGVSGGVASRGAFFNTTLANYAYCFSDNMGGYPAWVAAEIGHQAGRGFGLINTYNLYGPGATGSVYDLGTSTQAPIMGGGHFAQRENWWQGYNDHYLANQDDMASLAGTNNGFGYRADDYGNSISAAASLGGSPALSASGIIEPVGDVDYFSFSTSGGSITLRVDPAAYGPMLDPVLELRNGAGTLLASADASYTLNTPYPGDVITTTLGAGTYYVAVKGHGWTPETFSDGTVIGNGSYADVGQYTLSIAAAGAIATAPAAPTNLAATAVSSSQINLTWNDDSSDDTGILLDRATNSAFTQNLTTTSLDSGATRYGVSGLASATTYYFRIRATNSTGTSANSNSASATTAAIITIPAAPSNLLATAISSIQINLSWTQNSGNETGFLIDRATDSAFTQNLITASVGSNYTAYAATGLAGSTTYYFRVRAVNGAGASTNSNTANATTAAIIIVPSAPSNLVATAISSNQINLSWTQNSGNETGFLIDRATDSAFTQNLSTASVGSNVTSYSATGLAGGTTYYFRVRATNSAGSSANSNTASATTAAIINLPAAPSNLFAIAVSSGQVNLSWSDNSSNESGFLIDRATDSSFTQNLITTSVGSNVNSYSATGLASSTAYYFRVRATNSGGSSANSNTASALTSAAGTSSSAPTDLTASFDEAAGTMTLTWTDNSTTELAFMLQYSIDDGRSWNYLAVVQANTTTYIEATKDPATIYRIAAFDATGRSTWDYSA